jgi:hypothetical protein
MPGSFDLDSYIKESSAASGVPERIENPDTIREAVCLLLAMRASKFQSLTDQSAKTGRNLGPSKSSRQYAQHGQ